MSSRGCDIRRFIFKRWNSLVLQFARLGPTATRISTTATKMIPCLTHFLLSLRDSALPRNWRPTNCSSSRSSSSRRKRYERCSSCERNAGSACSSAAGTGIGRNGPAADGDCSRMLLCASSYICVLCDLFCLRGFSLFWVFFL